MMAIVHAAIGADSTGLNLAALEADSECLADGSVNGPACAISALQHRAAVAANDQDRDVDTIDTEAPMDADEEDVAADGLMEEVAEVHVVSDSGRRRSSAASGSKCCKCQSGTISWSASGVCSHCNGRIVETKIAVEQCQKGYPNLNNKNCANQCGKVFQNGGSGFNPGGGQGFHCSTATKGTCRLMSCAKSRGPTDCVKKKCVCKPGYCADTTGAKCVRPPAR